MQAHLQFNLNNVSPTLKYFILNRKNPRVSVKKAYNQTFILILDSFEMLFLSPLNCKPEATAVRIALPKKTIAILGT